MSYVKPVPRGTEDITAPRLNLRKFKAYDALQMFKWSEDEETLKYFQTKPARNVEEAEMMISSWRGQYQNDDFLRWCIAEADGNKAVGEISASLDLNLSQAEIEYTISPDARGKGYATEALAEVIRYLHEQVGIHRVVIEVNVNNVPSNKVAEKAGMSLDGILPGALVDRHGEFYDVALYSHVAEDIQ